MPGSIGAKGNSTYEIHGNGGCELGQGRAGDRAVLQGFAGGTPVIVQVLEERVTLLDRLPVIAGDLGAHQLLAQDFAA